jgi:hypothetical protein
VTYLPSRPAKGLVLTQKFMVNVGSSIFSMGNGAGFAGSVIGHANANIGNAVDQHDVARTCFGGLHTIRDLGTSTLG